MADNLTQGNKTVRCRCGHVHDIPFQTTIYKCPKCGEYGFSAFHGVVVNKDGDYIY